MKMAEWEEIVSIYGWVIITPMVDSSFFLEYRLETLPEQIQEIKEMWCNFNQVEQVARTRSESNQIVKKVLSILLAPARNVKMQP